MLNPRRGRRPGTLELAGLGHRVEEFVPDRGAVDDPEFGEMVKMVGTTYADPTHDPSRTTAALGFEPTPLDEGLRLTVDWIRGLGRLWI